MKAQSSSSCLPGRTDVGGVDGIYRGLLCLLEHSVTLHSTAYRLVTECLNILAPVWFSQCRTSSSPGARLSLGIRLQLRMAQASGCLKEEPSPLQGVDQSLIERPDITVVATHSRLPAVTSGLSTLVGPAFGELSGELLAGLAALECLHMRQCLPIAAKERSCG